MKINKPTMPQLFLNTAGRSQKGKNSVCNEDYHLIENIAGIYIVADGLGGYAGGQHASQLTTMIMHQFIQYKILHSKGASIEYKNIIENAAISAHEKLIALQTEHKDLGNMGSSFALLVWESPSAVHVANIGDSRVYYKHDKPIEQLSKDHRTGRKQLTQAIGVKLTEGAFYKRVVITDNGRILLCTNGLWEIVDEHALEKILLREKRPTDICIDILNEAKNKEIFDDLTMIVLVAKFSKLSKSERDNHERIRQLIIRYLDGDEYAFELIYNEFRYMIRSFINSKILTDLNDSLIDDTCQEAWLMICNKLITYNMEFPFHKFAMIWTDIAIKQMKRKIKEDRHSHIETDIPEEEPPISYTSEDYFLCLRILLSCPKLPHEVLVYALIKVLGYKKNDIIEKFSSIPLKELLLKFKMEYSQRSTIPINQIEPSFFQMEDRLKSPLENLLLNEPRSNYANILNQIVGETCLNQYFHSDSDHQIDEWTSRVKKKVYRNF